MTTFSHEKGEVMIRLLIVLLFFSTLQAEWEQLFPQYEDPTVAHHVNVISGNLSLSLLDTVVQGPIPLPIMRSYSSSGALERDRKDNDRLLNALQQGKAIQGGWSFLPHLHLLIERKIPEETCKAYLGEGPGFVEYRYCKTEGKYTYILVPLKSPPKHSGSISARNNLFNYRLHIEAQIGRATLYLPTGGSRIYEGYSVDSQTIIPEHYKLAREILPSGHRIEYFYNSNGALKRMELKNPGGTKTYSWVDVKMFCETGAFPIALTTSFGQKLSYAAMEHKKRRYINQAEGSCLPKQSFEYSEARRGIGARVCSLSIAGHMEFFVDYVLPKNNSEAKKWEKKPEKKGPAADKVAKIQAPIGPKGKLGLMATFNYEKESTDVRDAHHFLTSYHHDGEKLQEIRYFDEDDNLYSIQEFVWGESMRPRKLFGTFGGFLSYRADDRPFLDPKNKEFDLLAKAMCSSDRRAVFVKTFVYDDVGNIEQEVLWGNLTGTRQERFDFRLLEPVPYL